MLGIEVRDRSVVAVALSDDGRVLRRASGAAEGDKRTEPVDLEAVASTVLNAIADPQSRPDLVGVACGSPDAPACAAALQTIAARHGGAMAHDGAPVAPGPAAAVAEAWIGAARDAADVVVFNAGRTMTAGIVRGGHVVKGSHGRAAAVSWLALNPVEREDYRKIGCLQAEAAAAGIVRRFVWRIKAGDRSSVQDVVGEDLAAISLDHVLGAARAGDGVAISVVRDTAKYLGMAAANLVVVVDPECLVVGGIMASAADVFLEPLRAEIARRLPAAMMQTLSIVPAALGDEAPAIGAARLASAALR
jgi:glucokinase